MKKAFKQLLEDYPKDGTNVLSIYYPYETSRPIDFSKKVLAYAFTKAKSHKLATYFNFPDKLKRTIGRDLHKKNDFKKGISVFAEFGDKKLDQEKRYLSPESFRLDYLSNKPQKYAAFDRLPDIRQLIKNKKHAKKTAVALISREKAILYKFQSNNLEKIFEHRNDYALSKQASQYQQKYSPNKNKAFIHSTGSANKARRRESENKNFLNEIEKKMRPYLKNTFKRIVIIYSNEFMQDVDSFSKSLQNIDGSRQVFTLNKNINKPKRVKKEVRKLIKSVQKNNTKKKYADSRETGLLVTGLNAVSKALRQQKVQKLFIKPRSKKSGYIMPGNLLFSYPVKGSKKIRNIFPWIVKISIETGAEIVILPEENRYSSAAALMRY